MEDWKRKFLQRIESLEKEVKELKSCLKAIEAFEEQKLSVSQKTNQRERQRQAYEKAKKWYQDELLFPKT